MDREKMEKRCPLCGHDSYLEIGIEREDGYMFNRIRCPYCGCQATAPHDEDGDYLRKLWNNRIEHCPYCGELTGSANECPKCGMSLEMVFNN